MEQLKSTHFCLHVAILIFCTWCRIEAGTEPVCYSRFDIDYKVMQKLAELESKQLALQEVINSQSSLIMTLENKLQDSLQAQWGSWTRWSDCFMDCSGNNSGRIQTRSRSMSAHSEDLPTETESRPCNAVQFAGCVKDYGPKDNYGITYDSADQVAVSICTSIYSEGGGKYIYAVRRECSKQVVSCADICKNAGTCLMNLPVRIMTGVVCQLTIVSYLLMHLQPVKRRTGSCDKTDKIEKNVLRGH